VAGRVRQHPVRSHRLSFHRLIRAGRVGPR
jgi:hypothetical protein